MWVGSKSVDQAETGNLYYQFLILGISAIKIKSYLNLILVFCDPNHWQALFEQSDHQELQIITHDSNSDLFRF